VVVAVEEEEGVIEVEVDLVVAEGLVVEEGLVEEEEIEVEEDSVVAEAEEAPHHLIKEALYLSKDLDKHSEPN
jgi:hypothetical protein